MALGDRFDDLLASSQDGDADALSALYRDLAPLVLGYLRARGARDPEDLTSETFVAVVRNVDRFRGDETKFRSWVLTIAHRRLVDARRRSGRRPETLVEPDVMGETVGSAARGAEIEAVARIADEDMLALMEQLTEEQRAVLMLRVVADLPVVEVARILRKRPGAIKTMQRRALASLGRLLESERAGPTQRPEGQERDEVGASSPLAGESPSPPVSSEER